MPPGQLVLAAALSRRDGVIVLDEAKDLLEFVDGSEFSWQAPPGEWFVVVMTDDLIYEGTHAAISLAYQEALYRSAHTEPTARFLEVTHARYAEKLGNDLGRYFVSDVHRRAVVTDLWFRPCLTACCRGRSPSSVSFASAAEENCDRCARTGGRRRTGRCTGSL